MRKPPSFPRAPVCESHSPAARPPAARPRAGRALGALCGALLLASACAYEVIPLDPPATPPALSEPMPLTIAVGVQSFEVKLLKEDAFTEEFADQLKKSRIFQSVIFPVPKDLDPIWSLKLLVKDKVMEGSSNGWKGALAAAFSPFAYFIHLQTEYTLEVEGLLARRREVVATYPVAGRLRYTFQINTNSAELQQKVASTVLDLATRQLLAALAADADHIRAEDRARMGK